MILACRFCGKPLESTGKGQITLSGKITVVLKCSGCGRETFMPADKLKSIDAGDPAECVEGI